jgi:hypothetical protein
MFKYKNGDEVQVFALNFVVREWSVETDDLDEAEIAEKRWVLPNELDSLNIEPENQKVIAAYRKYVETGQFQMINFEEEKS